MAYRNRRGQILIEALVVLLWLSFALLIILGRLQTIQQRTSFHGLSTNDSSGFQKFKK